MNIFPDIPPSKSSGSNNFRLNVAKLGDGNSQIARDGINFNEKS